MKHFKFFLIVACLLLLTGCAEQTNVQSCVEGEPYGFWSGLLHGIIALPAFVVSLFDSDVAVWAVNNNGNWYTFGFVLGAGILGRSTTVIKKRK